MAKARGPLRLFKRDHSEFDRGLSFFDAVFGFALTLLIANIDLPPAEAWASIGSLLDHGFGDQLVGFLVSFAVIAVFWKVNYDLLGSFRGLTDAVIIANIVIVVLIVFLPFTTQGISDPAVSEMPLATALYGLNVAFAIIAQSVMFEIGRAQGLVVDDVPVGARWPGRVDVAAKVLVFLVSVPVAFAVSADWGRLTWLILLIIAPVVGIWADRKTRALAAQANSADVITGV